MNLFPNRRISVLVLFSCLALGTTSANVTINGSPLSDILTPGENCVTFAASTEKWVHGVSLSAEGGNFKFGSIGFPEKEVLNIKNEFKQLSSQVQDGFSGRNLRLSSPVGNYEGLKFSATEDMIVGTSGATLTFANSLFESPSIIFGCQTLDCKSSYLI